MRRRPNQTSQSSAPAATTTEPVIGSSDLEQSGISSSSYTDNSNNIVTGLTSHRVARHPMMTSYDVVSGSSDDDGERKPPSILPRNYTGRRQLIIAGSCFLVLMAFLQVTTHGKNESTTLGGKGATNSSSSSSSPAHRDRPLYVSVSMHVLAVLGTAMFVWTITLRVIHSSCLQHLGL